MRTLVICDDPWHPARTARDGLAPLSARGVQFDWIEDAAHWSANRMSEYPVVLFAKSDNVSAADKSEWATKAVQDAFVGYVRGGNGLLVVHSGTVYAQQPTLRALIGGAFIRHPKQCPVTIEPKEGHPLTAGSTSFTLVDEHYIMELDDPQADVFLTTSSEHGTQPGGWTRVEGEGRVCVLTPGHNVEIWRHPSFQALLVSGMRWCSKTLEQESG